LIYKWRESGSLRLSGISTMALVTRKCVDVSAFVEMMALKT
jgi:hypothetical protein